MVPSINQVIFFLSTLFGLNTIFVAEECRMTLNLETKVVTIEYFDLKTLEQLYPLAEKELTKIDSAKTFNENYGTLTLQSKEIQTDGEKLNAHLTFSFENQDELFNILRFNVTHYGEKTSSQAYYYHLFQYEELISTNGALGRTKDGPIIKWEKNAKVLSLEMKQKESIKEHWGETFSIVEFWKK